MKTDVILVEERRYVENGVDSVDIKVIDEKDVAFVHVGAMLVDKERNCYMIMNTKEALKIVDSEKITNSVDLLKEYFEGKR